ncbi:MAG: hypothetical protein QOH16_639 [Gaiellaceae bacterium]|nr:hypothetical protein [Gaiellaceae bacterium]
MDAKQSTKTGAAIVGGLAGGVVAAVGALVVIAAVVVGVIWLTADGPTEHAQQAISSAFVDQAGVRTAKVASCRQVSADSESRIFRCQIDAPRCSRSFLFDAPREVYGIAPATASVEVFVHPCKFRSDPVFDPDRHQATIAMFTGYWWGHGRGLTISRGGRASERLNANCCKTVLDVVFQLSHPRGTRRVATVTATVTAVRVRDRSFFQGKGAVPPPQVGESRRLLFRDGRITETLTGTNYCAPSVDGCGL